MNLVFCFRDLLTFSKRQIDCEDFINFCGLLAMHWSKTLAQKISQKSLQVCRVCIAKFMFSKKATKIDEIFTGDVISVKSMVKILPIFVAFLGNMNFITLRKNEVEEL